MSKIHDEVLAASTPNHWFDGIAGAILTIIGIVSIVREVQRHRNNRAGY